ncbi:MAG: hypothetical protein A2546_07970 [Sphingobacteriia bacterium RIFOXYD2_FULL_35_12]|uniref:CPBP family intramembrane glutamic endopeptidase n=1 Tax=Sediminibacterium sp. TaxID=1917865 RepID=UPI0008D2353F|nr:MAG: hypothetical protein A2472_11555 [Sphingobacteriia bacterium RIFOXYC2_FULL_35_18]OHC87509.1 MAG: hypothetical protein A2546_07970 [Sphingobacteriia bacterium RIFOXYD2_FULL_35_12]
MGHFLFRMNDLYLKKVRELSKISQFKLIILTVIIEISVTLIFSFLLFPNHNAGPTFDSKLEEFFIVVIFAPILETLIFQYSIISYILGKRPNAYLFTCIFSAILFGLSHFYSPEYILKTFFSGLLFGTLYLVVQNKNNNAFIIVAIAHSIYNFIGFCLRQI